MREVGHQRAINALMEEYEKALNELYVEISPLNQDELIKVLDADTEDADCRSIQTILRHILQSGYGYIVEIDKYGGGTSQRKHYDLHQTCDEAILALKAMHFHNVQFFENNQHIPLYEKEASKRLVTQWGQNYDVDQLLEHAVMHVHRHRRQIVNFKKLL